MSGLFKSLSPVAMVANEGISALSPAAMIAKRGPEALSPAALLLKNKRARNTLRPGGAARTLLGTTDEGTDA